MVIAAGFLPLLVHELGADFAETRAILGYVAGGGREAATGVLDRIVTVGLRSITWPVTGLITDRLAVSLIGALIVMTLGFIAVVGRRRGDRPEVTGNPTATATAAAIDLPAVRWLAGSLGDSVVALAVFAPSLAIIVPELPNDHYHAFLDPIVLTLVGVGLARLAGAGAGAGGQAGADATQAAPRARRTLAGRLAAVALTVVLAAIAITAWPPTVAPDGGWPLADAAAGRVLGVTGREPFALDGLPEFKNANALRFPLERRDATVLPAVAAGRAASWWSSAIRCSTTSLGRPRRRRRGRLAGADRPFGPRPRRSLRGRAAARDLRLCSRGALTAGVTPWWFMPGR